MKPIRIFIIALSLSIFSALAHASDYNSAVQAKVILKSKNTATGQAIQYLKTDNPEVTVIDVVLPPGTETGWHIHPVPVYAYVLSGELEVRMEDGRSNRYKEGDAIIEAVNTRHNGRNVGTALVHLVVFYTGEEGKPVMVKTAASDDASVYYPLKVGNSWTYSFGEKNGTSKYEVMEYSKENNAYIVKNIMKAIDVNIASESIMENKDGCIYNIGGTDIKGGKARRIFNNKEIVLKSPIKVGMTWSYERDNDDNNLKCIVKCKVVKIGDCTVKAGKFSNVCAVERRVSYIDEDGKEKTREVTLEYYAPDVGEIKEEVIKEKPETTLELLDYNIK